MSALAGGAVHANEPDPRPNVLLILFDDLGYSDLGCYGGEIPTPPIDTLAEGGLRYTAMTNSARCCPSRASLLTGLHPGQTGIPNFGGRLNKRCVTLAEVLGADGYQTYMVGKWHVGSADDVTPTARGFDEFYGYKRGHSQDQWTPSRYQRLPEGREPELAYDQGGFYATDVFTDYAIEFLNQAQGRDKPWFLFLSHSSPHFPVQAPPESTARFVETYRQGWDVLRAERFERMRRIGLIDHDGWAFTERSLVPVERNAAVANGYPGQPNPAWNELDADRQMDLAHRMAIYAAMVKHVDDGVGRIVEQLKASGDYDNTIVLILSDNGACYEWGPFGFDGRSRQGHTILHTGEELATMGGPGTYHSYGSAWANLCNTPFRLYKHFTHRGGITTPFVVSWPAHTQGDGRWVRDPAHVMDIMPTLVDATGSAYPQRFAGETIQPMEGVSLLPTFREGGELATRTICYQHAGARAVRRGQWKLVYGKRFPEPAQWELYNLEQDPCETNDLAAQRPELVEELAAAWAEWSERTGATAPPNQ